MAPPSGVNRRFQAKLAKSKNMHIIKTTASIPTKFFTVIKIMHQMPFVVGLTTRITNPRWRTTAILEKSKNHHLGNGLTDFDEIWRGDTVRPLQPTDR